MVEDGYGKAEEGDGPDYRRIAGMDPAANWLLGIAADEFLIRGAQTEIPFLVVFEDVGAVDAFWTLVKRVADDPRLRVRILSDAALRDPSRPVACAARRAFFDRLAGGEDAFGDFAAAKKSIVLSDPAYLPVMSDDTGRSPTDEAVRKAEDAARDKGDAPGGTVVMAVIDDGIGFAHARFRNAAGTRIAHFWNMNLWPGTGSIATGPLGGELGKAQIDGLIAGATHGGAVDEDEVYRRAGLVDHADPRHKGAAWRVAHGTAVMDLAAGRDAEEDARDRPIIAVQLPTLAVARPVGQLLDLFIYLALEFVLARADAMAGEGAALPLVVNTSFGYIAGAHDGGAPLERVFDAVIAARAPKVQIVLPAGNAQVSQCHAEIDLAANEQVAFDWVVQPDDRTHSLVEVWLPASATPDVDAFERVVMTVTQPDGTQTSITETPFAVAGIAHRGRAVGLVMLLRRYPDGRRMLRLQILQTARVEPDPRARAPAGRWRLSFARGANAIEGAAHAWSERDDRLYGYPQRGRQAYFDHAEYRRLGPDGAVLADEPAAPPEAPIVRASLLNSFASGARVITAGGYVERDCRIADYSAGGPNTPPEAGEARKPDVLIPSDGSEVLHGVLAAGSRSGGRVALDGTSVAAPQLARHVADRLAAGEDADRAAVAAMAASSGVCAGEAGPPERSGWGHLARGDGLGVRRLGDDGSG